MSCFKLKRKGSNAALLLLILVLMLFTPVVAHAAEDDPGTTVVTTEASGTDTTADTSADSGDSGGGSSASSDSGDGLSETPSVPSDSSGSSTDQTDDGAASEETPAASSDIGDGLSETPSVPSDSSGSSTDQTDGGAASEETPAASSDIGVEALSGGITLMSSPEAAGAGDPVDSGVTATPTTTDNTSTTADYEVPAGSAYVVGSESTVYENSAAGNAIQQAVDAAIASAQKSITIVVNDGVYSGGITVIGKPASQSEEGASGESGTEDSSIVLKIVAHDALTTTEETDGSVVQNVNADSAGGVQVEGDLTFKDIQVLLAGIYLSLQNKVTVTNAKSVEYYGTAADDNVTIEMNNVEDSVMIDLGDGDDKLDATVTQSPTITINLGEDGSEIFQGGNLTDAAKTAITNGVISGISALTDGESKTTDVRLKVQITGGNGDDEIEIKLVNSTDITPETSDGTSATLFNVSSAKIDLDLSAADLAINGSSGADVITVEGGMKLGLATVVTQPILNALYTGITQLSQNSGVWDTALLPGTTVQANGGTGDDIFNIDTTVAFSTFRGTEVTVDGASDDGSVSLADAGFDRTHIVRGQEI